MEIRQARRPVLTPLLARLNPHRNAAVCLKELHSNGPAATSGRANRPRPKQVNSCGKKCTTSARASTARSPPNRRYYRSLQGAASRGHLRPPARGRTSEKTRRSAMSAYRKGRRHEPVSSRRSEARSKALRREGRSAASHRALSGRRVARLRVAADRAAAPLQGKQRARGHETGKW